MLRVLITNEKGEVHIDEQVEGYALTTVAKLKGDRTNYQCMAVVGGKMDVQGYMALDKNANIELPKRTKQALMSAVESALDDMEPSQLLRMMQDSLELVMRIQERPGSVNLDDLNKLFRQANDAEQESMRNYFRQQENK
jgi:uncharacterized protein (DUF1778 family)